MTDDGTVRPPRVVLRRPTEDDIPAIRRIGHETWPPTYGFAGEEYVAAGLAQWWSEDFLRESLATTEYWLAEVDGEPAGVGNVDLSPPVPVIWKLYVRPAHHRTGVGTALLDRLIETVPADRGRVSLEYLAGNDRAAIFYVRHGFTETRRDPAERPDWPDWVWVERPLVAAD